MEKDNLDFWETRKKPEKPDTVAGDKKKSTAALLCFFFGLLGAHRFYVGKPATGIATILTAGLFGIWTVIDFIRILVGSFKDANGNKLV